MKHRMVAQLRERCSSVGSASEGRGSVVEQILPYSPTGLTSISFPVAVPSQNYF